MVTLAEEGDEIGKKYTVFQTSEMLYLYFTRKNFMGAIGIGSENNQFHPSKICFGQMNWGNENIFLSRIGLDIMLEVYLGFKKIMYVKQINSKPFFLYNTMWQSFE